MTTGLIRFYRRTLMMLLGKIPWLAAGTLIVFSAVLVRIIEGWPESITWFGFSRSTALALAAAMLAASLFFVLESVIASLRRTEHECYKHYHKLLNRQQGVVAVYDQRGGSEAIEQYKTLLGRANHRIWAIGMTNGALFAQHQQAILEAVRDRPRMDARIVFLDPTSKLPGNPPVSLVELQYWQENSSRSSMDWQDDIESRSHLITDPIVSSPIKGRCRIYYLRTSTHFSTFVIDDDIFFFPFLSLGHSTQSPIIRVDAGATLGNTLVNHYTKVLDGPWAKVIYDNRA